MSQSLTSVIIDDEVMAADNLALTIERFCPELEVLGKAHNIQDGFQLIKKTNPRIVFLDISLTSDETGFDLLELFPTRDFYVVFVTAYAKYSLKAIKNKAFDYLLKPINYKELVETVNEIKLRENTDNTSLQSENNVIPIPTIDGTHLIKHSDILYCKADGSYTEFVLEDTKKLILSKPMKYAEELINSDNFMRVHRSYLINIDKINKLYFQDGGYVQINSEEIPVSKSHMKLLKDMLL